MMADRIIRDELLESDRWLDLPTDAARLAFVGFVLICDDFGNLEGGQRRIYRFLHRFTQIKTQEACDAVLDSLLACDLLRRYEVEGRELFHIPRFKSHRQYLSRAYPLSPWCPTEVELGKDKRVINKGLAKNVVTTSLPRSNRTAEGVGVGVELNTLAPSGAFEQFWSAYPRKKSKGQAEKAWKKHANGNIDAIMTALVVAKQSNDWTKDSGKWIPYPASWINAKGWLDEVETIKKVFPI